MMFMCGSAVRGFGCIGAPFVRGVTRRGVGWAVAARFNGPDMGARGELHYKAVRHAGDAPLGGFV